MSGVIGIIYNTAVISDEITSWGALFDPKYTGQILMFDNPRDAMAIALMYLGYSVNTTNTDELNAAYNLLLQQKPLKQAYVMDQIFDKLEGGEAAIGPYYAGDYLTMRENNPDLRFVVPEEGTNRFVDAMCIPKGAKNKKNAELFINFMCSTEAALKNTDMTWYTTANKEAAQQYAEALVEDAQAVRRTLGHAEIIGPFNSGPVQNKPVLFIDRGAAWSYYTLKAVLRRHRHEYSRSVQPCGERPERDAAAPLPSHRIQADFQRRRDTGRLRPPIKGYGQACGDVPGVRHGAAEPQCADAVQGGQLVRLAKRMLQVLPPGRGRRELCGQDAFYERPGEEPQILQGKIPVARYRKV
jgi:hypothetical protein